MATFGNNMWGTGELNPANFAANGTHNQAVAAINTRANPSITDSFIGTPLALGSESPPAGPIEESLRGMGDGWKGLPAEGKIVLPVLSLAGGFAISSITGSITAGIVATGAIAIMGDGWLQRRAK